MPYIFPLTPDQPPFKGGRYVIKFRSNVFKHYNRVLKHHIYGPAPPISNLRGTPKLRVPSSGKLT